MERRTSSVARSSRSLSKCKKEDIFKAPGQSVKLGSEYAALQQQSASILTHRNEMVQFFRLFSRAQGGLCDAGSVPDPDRLQGAEHALETITFKAANLPRICRAVVLMGPSPGAYSIFLLEASDLQFEGVSGTSAGAMNAVVLADGLMKGGRDGRAALAEFWREVAPVCPSRWRCAHSMAKV